MVTLEKSLLLWIGGAIAGGVAAYVATDGAAKVFAGSMLGAILVGATGDAILDRNQREAAVPPLDDNVS